MHAENSADSAYLFVHFTGEAPLGEQINFAVSQDGLNWSDLNNSQPILISNLGEKGVRDPAIIRADNGHFYIIATDLRIANGHGWDAARFDGSHSLIFWESKDLIHWSDPWSVEVSSAIPGAGCTWAPEVIYDSATGDYVVYWATIATKDGIKEARIYTAKTKDFHSFTPAELYIERHGEGVNSKDIIDTQIIESTDGKYAYYRVSRDSQITVEATNSIFGEWTRIGDISHLGYTARDVEGPILFQFNSEQKWCLLVDRYATSGGYLPIVITDLSDPKTYRELRPAEYSMGASLKRHGGILNIAQQEYNALTQRWPSAPISRLESAGKSGGFLRHANWKGRFDTDVQPTEDAFWRIVPVEAPQEELVMLQAINFHGHYLVPTGEGVSLQVHDGSEAFKARASFRKVKGLSGDGTVSFEVPGSLGLYLMNDHSALTPAQAESENERENASFKITVID